MRVLSSPWCPENFFLIPLFLLMICFFSLLWIRYWFFFRNRFEEQEAPGSRSFFTEIIASISDVKFARDGRYLLSRDYMSLKVLTFEYFCTSSQNIYCFYFYKSVHCRLSYKKLRWMAYASHVPDSIHPENNHLFCGYTGVVIRYVQCLSWYMLFSLCLTVNYWYYLFFFACLKFYLEGGFAWTKALLRFLHYFINPLKLLVRFLVAKIHSCCNVL